MLGDERFLLSSPPPPGLLLTSEAVVVVELAPAAEAGRGEQAGELFVRDNDDGDLLIPSIAAAVDVR